jgi:hypothetical protein
MLQKLKTLLLLIFMGALLTHCAGKVMDHDNSPTDNKTYIDPKTIGLALVFESANTHFGPNQDGDYLIDYNHPQADLDKVHQVPDNYIPTSDEANSSVSIKSNLYVTDKDLVGKNATFNVIKASDKSHVYGPVTAGSSSTIQQYQEGGEIPEAPNYFLNRKTIYDASQIEPIMFQISFDDPQIELEGQKQGKFNCNEGICYVNFFRFQLS